MVFVECDNGFVILCVVEESYAKPQEPSTPLCCVQDDRMVFVGRDNGFCHSERSRRILLLLLRVHILRRLRFSDFALSDSLLVQNYLYPNGHGRLSKLKICCR